MPDEQVRGDAAQPAHQEGVKREQEERDEEYPREGEPELPAGEDLQRSEGHGEGEDLDDQHDSASDDVGELEEVQVQDPRRHEVEEDEHRERRERGEVDPRAGEEVERRHQAGDSAAHDEELVLLPLHGGRGVAEPVADDDV